MKNSQIAVQLWTLRNFLKTPADVVETFRKVRKIGYEAIELAGLPPMPDWKDALAEFMAAEFAN